MSDGKVVAVTGANGFIGKRYCAIRQRSGSATIACTRRPVELSQGDSVRHHVVSVDGGPSAWEDALGPADCVVHLAGLAHQTSERDESKFFRANFDGTKAVLDAAIACGASRFVFVSTAKVNGERTDIGRPFEADDLPNPSDHYSRSKYEAEQYVLRACQNGRIEACVIRPVLVYGPEVRANFLRLMSAVAARRLLPFGGVRNLRSILYVDNLCSLIDSCLEHSKAPGNVFMAADEEPLSTPSLIRELSHAMNVAPRLISVPPAMLSIFARVLGIQEQLAKMTESLVVDIGKNRDLLGWKPPIPTSLAFSETASWYDSLSQQS